MNFLPARALVTLLFFALAISASAANPNVDQYSASTFDYPGSDINRALGINNSGEIVGVFRLAPPRHAYQYVGGQFQAVPLPIGDTFSQAFGVNDNGDIVGNYLDDDGNTVGYLFTSSGTFTSIAFPGAIETDAFGVNNSDVVVGDFFLPDGSVHGFVWLNGAITQFDFPGASDTQCFGINNAGDISGAYDNDINTRGHGFLLSHGVFTQIDHPQAAPNSTSIFGINDRDDMVGVFEDTSGNHFGFLLSKSGGFVNLDFPAPISGFGFRPNSINNAGVIVGLYRDGGALHGFVAKPNKLGKPL